MATTYKYVVCDLRTGVVLEEMPFLDVSFSRVNNGIGNASASIPMRHPKATRTNLDPGRTTLFIMRGDVCVWGGILYTVKVSGTTELPMLDLGFEDFFAYFKYRNVRGYRLFNNVGDLTIVRSLFNTVAMGVGDVAGGNGGVVFNSSIPFPWAGVSQTGTEVPQSRLYELGDSMTIWDAVQEYVGAAGGPDLDLSIYRPGPGESGARFQPKIVVSRTASPTYREDLIFETTGRNVVSIGYSEDATELVTAIEQFGAGESNSTKASMIYNLTLSNRYGAYERVEKNTDVTDVAVLRKLAMGKSDPKRYPTKFVGPVEVKPDDSLNVTSYKPGQLVRVRVNDGWFKINQYTKIVSDTTKVTATGDESLTITLSPWIEGYYPNDPSLPTPEYVNYRVRNPGGVPLI